MKREKATRRPLRASVRKEVISLLRRAGAAEQAIREALEAIPRGESDLSLQKELRALEMALLRASVFYAPELSEYVEAALWSWNRALQPWSDRLRSLKIEVPDTFLHPERSGPMLAVRAPSEKERRYEDFMAAYRHIASQHHIRAENRRHLKIALARLCCDIHYEVSWYELDYRIRQSAWKNSGVEVLQSPPRFLADTSALLDRLGRAECEIYIVSGSLNAKVYSNQRIVRLLQRKLDGGVRVSITSGRLIMGESNGKRAKNKLYEAIIRKQLPGLSFYYLANRPPFHCYAVDNHILAYERPHAEFDLLREETLLEKACDEVAEVKRFYRAMAIPIQDTTHAKQAVRVVGQDYFFDQWLASLPSGTTK